MEGCGDVSKEARERNVRRSLANIFKPLKDLFTRGEGRAEEKPFRFSNLDDLSIFPPEINDDN